MGLTATSRNFLVSALVGSNTVPFDAAHAHLAVGNSNIQFQFGQDRLQGALTARRPMDPGYPIVNPPRITFKSTFGPDVANFAWREWGVFNHPITGIMLNRVVEDNGAKQSGQTWVLEVDITFDVVT